MSCPREVLCLMRMLEDLSPSSKPFMGTCMPLIRTSFPRTAANVRIHNGWRSFRLLIPQPLLSFLTLSLRESAAIRNPERRRDKGTFQHSCQWRCTFRHQIYFSGNQRQFHAQTLQLQEWRHSCLWQGIHWLWKVWGAYEKWSDICHKNEEEACLYYPRWYYVYEMRKVKWCTGFKMSVSPKR